MSSDPEAYSLNKRLAEIAGIRLTPGTWRCGGCDAEEYRMSVYEWSPLTDWSQLRPMLEAHDVSLRQSLPPIGRSSEGLGWEVDCGTALTEGVWDADLKRAIALAIIAAHEEARDEG